MTLLLAQRFRARGEAVAEMKADGLDYDERVEALDEITWPQPLAALLEDAWVTQSVAHPWLVETPVSPKAIVRDMYAQVMFGEYVAHYKVQRSEGLLLRYLSDAWRALRQTVPEASRTDELTDLIAWLGHVTRMVDSSLLDEWARLAGMAGEDTASAIEGDGPPPPTRPVTGRSAFARAGAQRRGAGSG